MEKARHILLAINVDYAHDAALVDVSATLKEMDQAIRAFDPARPMRVSERVAFYKDANQRASHFAVWKQRNPEQAAKFTKEEWDEEMGAYGIIGDVAHSASQRNTFFHLGTMQNMVFRHGFSAKLYSDFSAEQRAQHQRRDAEWHEFAVLLKGRNVSLI